MSQTTTLMEVRTVALPVIDQDRAVEFYVETLYVVGIPSSKVL